MKGYYKNKKETEASMKNGWFHSGDLAVMHPNGYIQIKDRSKDIIISGGENISSVEIENIIAKHDAVSLVAVVPKPDENRGETPCANIELKEGKNPKNILVIIMRFENLSQKTMNYYLSNNFERNKQMIREIREYINADQMNKDWIKHGKINYRIERSNITININVSIYKYLKRSSRLL